MDDVEPRAAATSRYLAVSRRAVLAALALGAGGALAGCSNGDEQALGTGTGTEPAGAGAAAADPQRPAASGALPDGASMAIRFTFAVGAEGRGPVRNPYIAVWIETPSEEMVSTIAVWHLQQNERWLGELRRWYAMAGGQGASVSAATRVPGEYTLEWDCTDPTGAKVAAGEYYVCIEAAREHGPYELIREPMSLGSDPVDKAFQPAGELTAASGAYAV